MYHPVLLRQAKPSADVFWRPSTATKILRSLAAQEAVARSEPGSQESVRFCQDTSIYTNTLGRLYGVRPERILFIRGCTDLADDEHVLGHAWRPQSRKSSNDRPDIEEIDTRLMEANDIIDGYVSAMFKRSTGLIVQHREFFEVLTEIEQVIVLEPSMLAVDAAYFTALIGQRSVAEARRQVACRSPAAPASNSV